MYSYPDMEFLELRTPTSVTPVTYYICTAYAMYSIGIAIVPRDYLVYHHTPNPYDEWPLLLQFGSHLDISGTNWEPAPTLTIGTYVRVRSYFPIDYPLIVDHLLQLPTRNQNFQLTIYRDQEESQATLLSPLTPEPAHSTPPLNSE